MQYILMIVIFFIMASSAGGVWVVSNKISDMNQRFFAEISEVKESISHIRDQVDDIKRNKMMKHRGQYECPYCGTPVDYEDDMCDKCFKKGPN